MFGSKCATGDGFLAWISLFALAWRLFRITIHVMQVMLELLSSLPPLLMAINETFSVPHPMEKKSLPRGRDFTSEDAGALVLHALRECAMAEMGTCCYNRDGFAWGIIMDLWVFCCLKSVSSLIFPLRNPLTRASDDPSDTSGWKVRSGFCVLLGSASLWQQFAIISAQLQWLRVCLWKLSQWTRPLPSADEAVDFFLTPSYRK